MSLWIDLLAINMRNVFLIPGRVMDTKGHHIHLEYRHQPQFSFPFPFLSFKQWSDVGVVVCASPLKHHP